MTGSCSRATNPPTRVIIGARPRTETYKLTTAEIPGRRAHSVYADILAEFRAGGARSQC